MEKLLFMAPVEINDANSGVTTKVKNEFSVFQKHFDAYLLGFEENDVAIYQGNTCVYRSHDEKKHRVFRQYDVLTDFDYLRT